MRKNQNGMSMITLIITIIVMIILTTTVFGEAFTAIFQGTAAVFENNMDEVQSAFDVELASVYGDLKAQRSNYNQQQVTNWVAKGGEFLPEAEGKQAWLPLTISANLGATQITDEVGKEIFGDDLPEVKVNTAAGTNVVASYFITKNGIVFIWPPMLNEEDGLYYVNAKDVVRSGDDPISGDADFMKVFESAKFKLTVGEDVVYINNTAASYTGDLNSGMGGSAIADMVTVYYDDKANAASPLGIEHNKTGGKVYNASGDKLVARPAA